MTVSILICTYGSDEWRELAMSRAYPSTIGQGETNPILVGLGATDVEVQLHHFINGISLADIRNDAARAAQGDWLCFLDADDELCPGFIDAMPVAQYALPSNGICDDASARLPQWRTEKVLLAPAVSYDGSRPGIPNRGGWPAVNECVIGTLVPRRLFLELGGFRETSDDGTPLTIYEDWDAFLRMADAGARIVHIPEAVYCARGSDGRNSGSDWKLVYDAIWADHLARVAVTA